MVHTILSESILLFTCLVLQHLSGSKLSFHGICLLNCQDVHSMMAAMPYWLKSLVAAGTVCRPAPWLFGHPVDRSGWFLLVNFPGVKTLEQYNELHTLNPTPPVHFLGVICKFVQPVALSRLPSSTNAWLCPKAQPSPRDHGNYSSVHLLKACHANVNYCFGWDSALAWIFCVLGSKNSSGRLAWHVWSFLYYYLVFQETVCLTASLWQMRKCTPNLQIPPAAV
jgi:hypothetical protein